MTILKNTFKVVGTIAFIICGVIALRYILPEYDKVLIESSESRAAEQFETQKPTTGKINEITLLRCKTVFVENTADGTEECRLNIVTNSSDTITVSIIHEDGAFKYHNAEISVGDTIEYRVDTTDRLKRRFHQPTFYPDTIDSINGVTVKHKE